MSISTRKAEIRELLAERDYDSILIWAASARSPQRVLFSLALDSDELIAWRAVEGLGRVTGAQAGTDLEPVRDTVRRLLWLMNDESGGLGWRSPEMIGEILVNIPDLIDEYGKLLTAYFREEPFERGAHLAVSRMATVNPDPFVDSVSELRASLDNPDAAIRFHAASALWTIDKKDNRSFIEPLLNDTGPLTLYDFHAGAIIRTTVREAVTALIDPAGNSAQAT